MDLFESEYRSVASSFGLTPSDLRCVQRPRVSALEHVERQAIVSRGDVCRRMVYRFRFLLLKPLCCCIFTTTPSSLPPLLSTMTSFYAENTNVQKGDRFETDCYYDTDLSSVGSDNVTFGLGSENEM